MTVSTQDVEGIVWTYRNRKELFVSSDGSFAGSIQSLDVCYQIFVLSIAGEPQPEREELLKSLIKVIRARLRFTVRRVGTPRVALLLA